MEYTLNLIAERSVVRESIKGVLWSIFFYRLFGPIVPTTNDFLNVTYPMATDQQELDSLIDEKINLLIQNEFSRIDKDKVAYMSVGFLDKDMNKTKKKSGWFGQGKPSSADSKLWESWILAIKCIPVSTGQANMTPGVSSGPLNSTAKQNIELSIQSFENNLMKIIDIVDNYKSHIPPITSLESSPFPYTIEIGVDDNSIKPDSNEEEGWGTYIRKMLD